MNSIPQDDPLAVSIVSAIRAGDVSTLTSLLDQHAGLAASTVHDDKNNVKRSLLHVATDWPGHFANVAQTIKVLIASGANVNAVLEGPNAETPLHWAASSNDVTAIDALLDGGADLNAKGAVIAGGDPLEDAIGFQNWNAARRLVERGAKTRLGDESALGLIERIEQRFESPPLPSQESISCSFWNACCAGQLEAAQFLLGKGASLNWIPDWCDESPLDGAIKGKHEALVNWLKAAGAIRNAK